ncbi:RES domain-containing protein [Lishizhenia tianjinensis]|uniref:RES domain-containing protein n=1 Tax=Lishizhenia tianjinensis TaxID=477690 RepID=A0A1I6YYI8_9FLAO|nr:RES family NAD+ phosphorylase [Lishizhenia tianjinensis]SFT55535.1 RES domain-containing protein [Lishizhenia tianjinensis]
MKVYRLTRRKYARDLSGLGASLYGNRWNSKGVFMVYAAESRALALLEVLVHIRLENLPSDYVMVEIEIPDDLKTTSIHVDALDGKWNVFPHVTSTQFLGDDFVRAQKYAVCKVPSAVVENEFNYLLNPFHPDFKRVEVTSFKTFPVDDRLMF